jgi:tetratricopeptide (TPR) repeat protein
LRPKTCDTDAVSGAGDGHDAADTLPSLPPGGVELERGAALGRYIVIERLGAGAMGVVYAAYDPELDRKLAIKLLHAGKSGGSGSSGGRTRLVREAQSMARLQHPNVVAVHDVGIFEDQVFVAMEFVEGKTLRAWLREKPRSWRQVLEKFMQAGRGLAAAHAAGLVHRDFKPDNVLVGADGRVRVADFGLARAVRDDAPQPALRDKNAPLSSTVTQTGSLLGTPAYAAPEQLLGKPTDARSDQFSFCVSLYEALYGERPFSADTVVMLVAEIIDGKAGEPPEGSRVPSWLRRILLQGLRATPDQRHASMDALLGEMERMAAPRRAGMLAVAAALLVGGGVAMVALRHQQLPMCSSPQQKLASVWDASRRAAIEAAFRKTGVPFANDVLVSVEQSLDHYTQEWLAAHGDACRDGERGAEAIFYARMTCLSQRLEEVKAQTQVLSTADASVVENAARMVQALTPIDSCTRADGRPSVALLPADPALRARAEKIRQQIATVRAQEYAGRFEDATPLAEQALQDARALKLPGLEAEALFQLGELEHDRGDLEKAERSAHEAAIGAERAQLDALAARAWLSLGWITDDRAHYDQALESLAFADAAIERAGGDDHMRTELLNKQGNVRLHQGKPGDALEAEKAALALGQHARGFDERQMSWLWNDLGMAQDGTGDHAGAFESYERALEIKKRLLGLSHPDVAVSMNNLANNLEVQGRYADALSLMRNALATIERGYGPLDARVAMVRSNVADILLRMGKFQEALAESEHARADLSKSRTDDHPWMAYPLSYIGQARLGLGSPGRGAPELEQSLQIQLKSSLDATLLSQTRFALARALWAEGRHPRALELAGQARKGAEQKLETEIASWLAAHQ